MLTFDLANNRFTVTESRTLRVRLYGGSDPSWTPQLEVRTTSGLPSSSNTKHKWWHCSGSDYDAYRFDLRLGSLYRMKTFSGQGYSNALLGEFALSRGESDNTYFFRGDVALTSPIEVEVFGVPFPSLIVGQFAWSFRRFNDEWAFDADGNLTRLSRFDRLGIFEM